MLKYQLNMAKAEAIYTSQLRAMYQNNPWIEALPDNPDDRELFKTLRGKIPYDAAERELPAYERRECIQSLSQVFVPWGKSGEIARKIYSAIRAGYIFDLSQAFVLFVVRPAGNRSAYQCKRFATCVAACKDIVN